MRLVPGLEEVALDRVCRRINRETDVGQRALAFYLNDMEERRVYQLLGFGSAFHYATARLDLTPARTYKLLAAGRALRELKLVDRAFADGFIAWSRVRMLVGIATPETEAEWLEEARRLGWAEFGRKVRTSKRGQKPRDDAKGLPEVRLEIRGCVDPLTHEMWQRAKGKLAAERGEPLTDGELMRTLSEWALSTAPAGAAAGRRPEDLSPFRIVVHSYPARGTAELQTADGLVPLAPETLEAIRPAAEVTEITAEDLARTAGEPAEDGLAPRTPAWMRDLVLARDGYRCRHCHAEVSLDAHHIVFRMKGGPTIPENLLTLCKSSHALVHEGLLVVSGTASGDLAFTNRAGEAVDRPAAPEDPLLVVVDPPAGTAPAGSGDPAVRLGTIPDAPDPEWWRGCAHLFRWNDRRGVTEFCSGRARIPPADPVPVPSPDPECSFDRIIGQKRAVAVLADAASAARARGESGAHVLLTGPSGLGKTSLARAYAGALGSRLHMASAPTLKDPGALLGLLMSIASRDVVFVDEIHTLAGKAATALFEAMEERRLSLLVTDGVRTRTIRPRLEPFTLVGTTTDPDACPASLRTRFPITESLEFYAPADLARIVGDAASRQGFGLAADAAAVLAAAGRDTPREALRLLTRVRNAALAAGLRAADAGFVRKVLDAAGIEADGMDPVDRAILTVLRRRGAAGPIGLGRLAASLGVSPGTIRDVHEPFLVRRGRLAATPRGRVAIG